MRAKGLAGPLLVPQGHIQRNFRGVVAQSASRRASMLGRCAVIIPAGAVAQTPAKGGDWRRVFGAARIESTAVKAHRNLDFQRYRESPHPGEGLLFRKEAKARAVLGLAEPVHPLPHLPRQSRLFGRRFRLHPLCGRRGMLFEYRAACLNPALALRMRARGSSKGRADAERSANAAA